MPPPKLPKEPPAGPPTERRQRDEEPGRRKRALRKERELKDDGRYMIFYDFVGEGGRG